MLNYPQFIESNFKGEKMKHRLVCGAYEIFVEPDRGEGEREVLEAVASASFELAVPDMISKRKRINKFVKSINKDSVREISRAYIHLSDELGVVVVAMPQVCDRWCMTFIERVGQNHFRLKNDFVQYRGLPDSMLKRAQEILADKSVLPA